MSLFSLLKFITTHPLNRNFLRKDDLFVDIGANVGSYTVLAGGHVGAKVVSIEPLPLTFEHLKRNIAINQIGNNVMAYNFALGNEKGQISFTTTLDTMNHVATGSETNTIRVPVETLDAILEKEKEPVLLKIDVEGFETNVLNGASSTLNKDQLKAIIIELNGSGLKYGYDEPRLHEKLLAGGYHPYQYNPFERQLTAINKFGTHNTIYIKDPDFVQERIKKADKLKILNTWI